MLLQMLFSSWKFKYFQRIVLYFRRQNPELRQMHKIRLYLNVISVSSKFEKQFIKLSCGYIYQQLFCLTDKLVDPKLT